MPPQLLRGNPAASLINLKLKQLTIKLGQNFKIPQEKLPKIALINACQDQESNRYIKLKKSIIESIGFSFNEYLFPNVYKKKEIRELILHLNQLKNMSGILLQLPIPVKEDTDELLNLIDPLKDIDGITDLNLSKIIKKDPTVIKSCAALGILHLLKDIKIDFQNTNFVLIGNGKLINYPLGLILKYDYNANNINVVDAETLNSEEIIKNGDVIVSATGVKERVKAHFIKNGSIIIDCGSINNKETEYEKVAEKASFITPIPGGVGPLTISYLMINVLKCYCLQNNIKFSEENIDFI